MLATQTRSRLAADEIYSRDKRFRRQGLSVTGLQDLDFRALWR